MKSIYVTCTCHHCGYQTHKQSETFIISDFEPHLVEALKTNRFFHTQCPSCQAKLTFFHPCLCIDKEYHLILYMKQTHERKQDDDTIVKSYSYKKRYISNLEDICEQYRIAEDALDDRAIQIVKAKLLQKRKDIISIKYQDYDKVSNTLWFQVQYKEHMDTVAIYKSSYEQIKEKLPPIQTNSFEEINLAWALDYIKNVKKL